MLFQLKIVAVENAPLYWWLPDVAIVSGEGRIMGDGLIRAGIIGRLRHAGTSPSQSPEQVVADFAVRKETS